MREAINCLTLFLAFTLITGCAWSGVGVETPTGGDTLTTESELLTLVDCGDYVLADIVNPWDTTQLMQRLILVGRGEKRPSNLPKGVVVEVPLTKSIVYSSVHACAIKELGKIGAINGVAEAQYYKLPEIAEGIKSGKVIDVGNGKSPDLESVAIASPDAIIASPFQGEGHGAVERQGIPIIEMADYMEPSPLGRAEWIKLLGRLYGAAAESDSIYAGVSRSYRKLSGRKYENRPKVISEMMTDGVWYVPGGKSYMARLFADAGGEYPWSGDGSTGSLALDFAQVYDQAHDADVWLVKTFGTGLSLSEMKASYPLNAKIKAYGNGGVFVCDTQATTFFEDFPFHPERLLAEYIKIFHPQEGDKLTYFMNVKE